MSSELKRDSQGVPVVFPNRLRHNSVDNRYGTGNFDGRCFWVSFIWSLASSAAPQP